MEQQAERELREALAEAWAEYKMAPPEHQDAAHDRYRALLDQFTKLVMPR
jgi:hypothetical protein